MIVLVWVPPKETLRHVFKWKYSVKTQVREQGSETGREGSHNANYNWGWLRLIPTEKLWENGKNIHFKVIALKDRVSNTHSHWWKAAPGEDGVHSLALLACLVSGQSSFLCLWRETWGKRLRYWQLEVSRNTLKWDWPGDMGEGSDVYYRDLAGCYLGTSICIFRSFLLSLSYFLDNHLFGC